MTDATIVVESAEKGGSLITADLATGYGKDCFAVPGRVNDAFSKGTNQLIRDNKAALIKNISYDILCLIFVILLMKLKQTANRKQCNVRCSWI